MKDILVNSTPVLCQSDNLAALLIELGDENAVVAPAVNGEFVAQHSRGTSLLKTGDKVEILAPMQGG